MSILFDKALAKYAHADFHLQMKARFLLGVCLFLLLLVPTVILYSSYLQLHNPLYGYQINFTLIMAMFLGFLVTGVAVILLMRGFFPLSAHMILIGIMLSIWAVMVFDQSPAVSRLDSIILSLAIMSMAPLVVTRRKLAILAYGAANIAFLFGYVFSYRSQLGLSDFIVSDYLADSTVAIVFVSITAYSLFSINTRSLNQAEADIQERRKAEDELQKLVSIVRHSSELINLASLDGKMVFLNEAGCAMLGIAPDRVNEVNIMEVVAAPVEERVRSEVLPTLMAGNTWEGELQYRNLATGQLTDVYAMIFAITDPISRAPLYLANVSRDITKGKRAEEALRKSEERYTRLVDTIPDFVVHTDLDGKIIFVNDYTLEMSGYSREEITGQNMLMFIAPEDQARAIENTLLMMEHRLGPKEYHLIMKDGRKINFEVNGDVLRNVDGTPFGRVQVCRDISLRKLAEQEKGQLQAQLIQAQKMESVGRLAGGVAHDFNNMLSVIIGNAEMAMQRIDPAEPLHKTLRDILGAGQRSADLTRQLLAFARKQTANPKVLDLNDTVAGMLKMLRRLIGEHIDLAWMPGHDLWSIRIDPSQVDQILANLLVNARDAIDQAGKIIIETSNTVCDEAFCANLPECIPGEYVLLMVSDDGCGMEPETLANIFEPFFTTKKEGRGTGLGLATVYGIVRQNGGFITVYSEPSLGATFKLYLPRYALQHSTDAGLKEDAKLQGGTETVLIVEDEESVLNLSKGMLERLGYRVLAVKGTEQALLLARQYAGDIDLLLTDVVMPDMNGRDLAERINAVKPGLKCLYMSGYTADVIAHHGILEEGVHFIPKPFTFQNLAEKVREALG